MLSWQCSILDIVPFGFFGGPFLPQIWIDLAEFSSDVVPHKINPVFEEFFKIFIFSLKGAYPKFRVLTYLLADLPLENPK